MLPAAQDSVAAENEVEPVERTLAVPPEARNGSSDAALTDLSQA